MSTRTAARDSTVNIRAATTQDMPAVMALLEAAHLPTDGLDEQFGPAYAVAECDGHLVGVEGIERYATSGLLRSATVDGRYRGLGIGDGLTRDRLAWALAQGLDDVWLLTTTAADYFPRFGFTVAERASAPDAVQHSIEFRDACPASAVAMRLTLGKEP